MKNLKSLIRAISSARYKNFENVLITDIVLDSREVKKGSLFVAIRGQQFDGHGFILEAVEKGAAAVVGERGGQEFAKKIPNYIQVEDSRKALSLLSSAWYGFPSRKLKTVGVTGTDGKSTTVNLIYSMLKAAGKKAGMVSSIGAQVGEKFYETGLHTTTPEPQELQKLLYFMVKEGCGYAVLEVTSHGLDQERVEGIDFEVGVLTNISPEHLDYHKTYQNYLTTKAELFARSKIAILNTDDKSYKRLLSLISRSSILSYAIHSKADIEATNIKMNSDGTSFYVGENLFETPLLGEYNVYNILSAIGVVRALGLDWEEIKMGVKSFQPLPGRFERIENDRGLTVVIDFAHTPNALEKVLKLCSRLKPPNSRLIVVFGCAGLRDRQKRPKMGKIAERLADCVVLTAEDPRTESVNDIIEQIAIGCREAVKIPDRQEAIDYAVRRLARAGDWVLLCGKGHEKSMCFGKTEYPWSEHDAVRKALE